MTGFDRSQVETDRLLAITALGGFVVVVAAVVGRISLPFLAVGALATVAFEAVALRYRRGVRAIWERPLVQLLAIGFGLVLAVLAWRFELVAVVSAGLGAIGAYLVLSALVALGFIEV